MDKDLIDFNSVKINSKTPNFKVTNAIIRWRNFIFIGACLILVIVLSVCFARMNSNINTKTEEINEMNGNINTNHSELQTLISSATEAKSTNEKLKVESDGYKQIIRQYKGDKKSLQSAIESYKTRMQEYGTYLSAKTEEKRIIVKEYSANKAKLDELISRNEALKKEYEELGGKPKEDITINEVIKAEKNYKLVKYNAQDIINKSIKEKLEMFNLDNYKTILHNIGISDKDYNKFKNEFAKADIYQVARLEPFLRNLEAREEYYLPDAEYYDGDEVELLKDKFINTFTNYIIKGNRDKNNKE